MVSGNGRFPYTGMTAPYGPGSFSRGPGPCSSPQARGQAIAVGRPGHDDQQAVVFQVLEGMMEARGAEVARAARLSLSAMSAALQVLAEHGLAVRGRGGWRRGPADLDAVVESTGTADLQREREAGTSRTGRAGEPGSGSTPAPVMR